MNEKCVKIDKKRALTAPSSVFATPEDVVSAEGIDRNTKIDILRRWGYHALELEVAEEENMTGGKASPLDGILRGLKALGGEPDVLRRPPTKQGGI